MDFEFSDQQEMLRSTVRQFLADRAPLAWVREMYDDPRGTTDEVWTGIADLGLTGILVPEEHGGLGMGMTDMGVVLEEMGRAVHPGPFLASAVGAVSLVTLAGSADDHTILLPGLASGDIVGTAAVSEPGRRDGWHDPLTEAKPDGDEWILSGTKVAVPDVLAADIIVVTATVGSELGAFVVDRGSTGIEVVPVAGFDRSRQRGRIELDGTPARRLGSTDARAAVAQTLDRLVVGLVVDGVGAASAALAMSVDYAKQRVQFDRPIGSFQAVQHLCADMLYDLELARAGAYYALWACDAADDAERHHAATMAKAWASDALFRVGASTIQVHGGIGFTWEHDAHLFYKRLLTLQHALGGTTEHLEELARLVLD